MLKQAKETTKTSLFGLLGMKEVALLDEVENVLVRDTGLVQDALPRQTWERFVRTHGHTTKPLGGCLMSFHIERFRAHTVPAERERCARGYMQVITEDGVVIIDAHVRKLNLLASFVRRSVFCAK